jgi:hypothetical protein
MPLVQLVVLMVLAEVVQERELMHQPVLVMVVAVVDLTIQTQMRKQAERAVQE